MIFFTRHKILRLMSYWGKAVIWANFLPSVAWAFIRSELPCSKSSKRSSWNNLRKPLHGAWKRKGLNKKPFHIYMMLCIYYVYCIILLCIYYIQCMYNVMYTHTHIYTPIIGGNMFEHFSFAENSLLPIHPRACAYSRLTRIWNDFNLKRRLWDTLSKHALECQPDFMRLLALISSFLSSSLLMSRHLVSLVNVVRWSQLPSPAGAHSL